MKKDFIKLNKLATVVMMATPVLSLLNGTTVFAADPVVNPAGTGKDGTLTSGRVIDEATQNAAVNPASGTYTPGSAGASGTPGVGQSTGAIEFYAGSLSLDAVPNFDFGAHSLQEALEYNLFSAAPVLTSDYKNSGTGKENDLGYYRTLRVTDRTAGSAGWKVTAWATPFRQKNPASGETPIDMHPTKITLTANDIDRQVLNPDSTDPTDVSKYKYTYENAASADDKPEDISSKVIEFSNTYPASSDSTAPTGTAVNTIWEANGTVASTGVAKGKGTWAADFHDKTAAVLDLPLTEQKTVATFESVIHWSLEAGV